MPNARLCEYDQTAAGVTRLPSSSRRETSEQTRPSACRTMWSDGRVMRRLMLTEPQNAPPSRSIVSSRS